METWMPWGARIGVLKLLTPITGTRRIIGYVDMIDRLKKSRRTKPHPSLPERLLSRFAVSLVEEILAEVEYLAGRQIYCSAKPYLTQAADSDEYAYCQR